MHFFEISSAKTVTRIRLAGPSCRCRGSSPQSPFRTCIYRYGYQARLSSTCTTGSVL